MQDESEERNVHRFEAFSDVVIGFSLAQLMLILPLPAKGQVVSLFAHPEWLFQFFWAFAMVCSMWWFHHRFFQQLFVPRTLPVLLNFVWLAVVVLCVYTAQLATKDFGDTMVWRMYFVLFALAYGILALQYRIGLRERGDRLPPDRRAAAMRAGTFMQLWTIPFVVCTIMVFVFPFTVETGLAIDATFIGTGIASVILGRRFRRQTMAA